MELITIIIAIIAIIVINSMMKVNIKKIEEIALNKQLNNIAKKYPSNKEICKTILEKLDNKTTKTEEDNTSNATLYIAIQDKITIGNMYDSFTRIQTIAHECLHSIQDRKMLIFNFIFSNIYLLYFFIICILVIMMELSNTTTILLSNILLILSFVYYVVRIFLENDAMIKAEYLAKDYMEEYNSACQESSKKQRIISEEEMKKIAKGFREVNDGIIKETNCSIFIKIMIKVVIFNVLALIF